jgi:hypothetical protein
MLTVGRGSLFFQLLLSLGIALVVFHAARFYRLGNGDGVAVRVSPEGLQVAAWGISTVPWSEIAAVRITGRTTVVIAPQNADLWFSRLKPLDRILGRLKAAIGSDPFTIDAGLLKGQPVELEVAIQRGLDRSRS